jgi:hypothetical protein
MKMLENIHWTFSWKWRKVGPVLNYAPRYEDVLGVEV